MQDAYNDMKSSDEGVEKLIELEVAFLNVRSSLRCLMPRVSVCFTLCPQGTRHARRNENAEEQGAGSGNTSLQSPLIRVSRPLVPGHWQYCTTK
jgi:hypothetical protein